MSLLLKSVLRFLTLNLDPKVFLHILFDFCILPLHFASNFTTYSYLKLLKSLKVLEHIARIPRLLKREREKVKSNLKLIILNFLIFTFTFELTADLIT